MTKEDILQWVGAVFVIVMYVLNAIGPSMYPYNIMAALCGTVCFMTWSILVVNKPQLLVNLVSLSLCVFGLAKAFFF